MEEEKIKEEIEIWNERFKGLSAREILEFFLDRYKGKIALASSLGLEDQVLTDMILKIDPSAEVFTIDTGRLFPETYSLIEQTNIRYRTKIDVYFPSYTSVEPFIKANGMNPFYESIEKRKACCRLRKIEPLLRALKPLDAWICGLRREQSVTRTNVNVVEWDANNHLVKINPLDLWSEKEVWEYIKENDVPYNVLHRKGYPSIGCQPCTRPVQGGEDVRAGRWWWESPEQKECGLHKR